VWIEIPNGYTTGFRIWRYTKNPDDKFVICDFGRPIIYKAIHFDLIQMNCFHKSIFIFKTSCSIKKMKKLAIVVISSMGEYAQFKSIWVQRPKPSNMSIYYLYTGVENYHDGNDWFIKTTNPFPQDVLDRVLSFYKYLVQSDYTHVFKTTLTTFLDFYKLGTFVENAPYEKYLSGTFRNYPYPDFKHPLLFCAGVNSLYSIDLIRFVVENQNFLDKSLLEDVCVTGYLTSSIPDIVLEPHSRMDFSKSVEYHDYNPETNFVTRIKTGSIDADLQMFKKILSKIDL
jgi:hypothetical protein